MLHHDMYDSEQRPSMQRIKTLLCVGMMCFVVGFVPIARAQTGPLTIMAVVGDEAITSKEVLDRVRFIALTSNVV
jgi:hypothetical protein